MVGAHLPAQPNLEQLRNRARDLQRAVRTGERTALTTVGLDAAEPDYPLSMAQLALARHYGFASWPRLRRHVAAIAARTWMPPEPSAEESPADRFLRLACLNYGEDGPSRRAEAAQLLDRDPDLPSTAMGAAAVCADVQAVRQHLARDPAAAQAPASPYGWSPLMYAAYARVDADLDATLATARLLLDGGADPNDGRFFLGLPTPFTVLTGVFGGGERDQPPHPHAIPLGRLLLARGADPNDGQTLYNRMFSDEDDFLEVLFEFGLGRGDGGPWRRVLPDVLATPTGLVRGLLDWAVTHDQRDRVALLARNGVDVVAPLDEGVTPIDVALRNGHRELAEQLRRLGAAAPAFDPITEYISAALAGDSAAVSAAPREVVEAARRARPALVVWATAQDRLAAVELLVASGFDVNAFGRGDVPVEQPWQTALHTAVECGSAQLVQRLLELGADPDLRDRRFDGTPLDWATHFQNGELVELLGR